MWTLLIFQARTIFSKCLFAASSHAETHCWEERSCRIRKGIRFSNDRSTSGRRRCFRQRSPRAIPDSLSERRRRRDGMLSQSTSLTRNAQPSNGGEYPEPSSSRPAFDSFKATTIPALSDQGNQSKKFDLLSRESSGARQLEDLYTGVPNTGHTTMVSFDPMILWNVKTIRHSAIKIIYSKTISLLPRFHLQRLLSSIQEPRKMIWTHTLKTGSTSAVERGLYWSHRPMNDCSQWTNTRIQGSHEHWSRIESIRAHPNRQQV